MTSYAENLFKAFDLIEALEVHLRNVKSNIKESEKKMSDSTYGSIDFEVALEKSICSQMESGFITELIINLKK